MIIINAEGVVLGRMASYAAKKALLGEKVIILNAEKALLSKSKKFLMKEAIYKLGIHSYYNPRKGPFLMKQPDNFVRRVIRGMLPYSKNRYGARGREAFKRVFVFIGVPDEKYIRKIVKENVVIDEKNFVNLPKKELMKYSTVGEFCKMLGSKI
ncbi:MAG: 50S ribosomal protein L13 [Candidatus Altarchaeaceae archaeon]